MSFCIHPGYSEENLIDQMNEAIGIAKTLQIEADTSKKVPKRLWVLFDEFNTSYLQALVSEIMTQRKVSFSKRIGDIPTNIVFIAACNPYSF